VITIFHKSLTSLTEVMSAKRC